MEERMTLKFVDDYLNRKMDTNDDYIVFTFYELRVKANLSQEDTLLFLQLVAQKLLNLGYYVYKEKQEYEYHGEKRVVKPNELLIAFK